MKFHENHPHGSRVVPNGQTDRRDECNNCVRNFANEQRDLIKLQSDNPKEC